MEQVNQDKMAHVNQGGRTSHDGESCSNGGRAVVTVVSPNIEVSVMPKCDPKRMGRPGATMHRQGVTPQKNRGRAAAAKPLGAGRRPGPQVD